ncbi:cytochrome c oxidase subunit 3 family protein [Undibacterium sp. Ren11W]|uniref:cytochrome c oxidase subunit 3 family protein n=1 Tax=Undibacterium sp. Ren11W TaxID=3413045 RepID=UPI003BF17542
MNTPLPLPSPAIFEASKDKHGRALPGDFAMWCFILAELLVFGIFFISYAVTRSHHIELFNQSQLQLDRSAGFINTLLLVSSSYFVVRAIAALQRDQGKIGAKWLLTAMLCGGFFLILKFLEFAGKYNAGINMSTNTFYMFYLFLAFFHFMHVILGMIILAAIAIKAWQGGYSAGHHEGAETGAAYWHMVDLVWIILFPLIYVLR